MTRRWEHDSRSEWISANLEKQWYYGDDKVFIERYLGGPEDLWDVDFENGRTACIPAEYLEVDDAEQDKVLRDNMIQALKDWSSPDRDDLEEIADSILAEARARGRELRLQAVEDRKKKS